MESKMQYKISEMERRKEEREKQILKTRADEVEKGSERIVDKEIHKEKFSFKINFSRIFKNVKLLGLHRNILAGTGIWFGRLKPEFR